MDNKALAAILADVLGSTLLSPRQRAKDLAARTTRDHVRAGRPTPKVGDAIRCLFSAGCKAFSSDPFICKDGEVYDVMAIGIDAINTARNTSEQIDELRRNMELTREEFPNVEGSILRVRHRSTGEELNTTFPCSPGYVFAIADTDSVSEAQHFDLEPRTPFRFKELTIIGVQHGDITPGTVYDIIERKPICSCEDPDCPGKGQFSYLFLDDSGEITETMIPFSFLGTCEPVKQ